MMDSELQDVDDNIEAIEVEDQEIDNLEDAADVIGDDETAEEIQDDDEADPDDDELVAEDDDEADADDDGDDMMTLPNGERVTREEGNKRFSMEQDYRHKTTELAEERRSLEQERSTYAERSQFVESTLSNFIGFLEVLLPEEPPFTLAQSDLDAYQYQRALREQAMVEIGHVVQMGRNMGEAKQGYSEQDMQKLRTDQEAQLVKSMPHLADPSKRAAFDKSVKATAIDFGFSEAEASGAVDSRIMQLVHYAGLGKRAVENRNNAKRRVEAPKTGKTRAAKAPAQSSQQRRAKERLSQTGSIEDALKIAFE